MEEILASIRRIISEEGDDTAKPKAATEPAPAKPAAGPPPSPSPAPQPAAEVLELTQMVKEDGTVVDVNEQPQRAALIPEPEPAPKPAPKPEPTREPAPIPVFEPDVQMVDDESLIAPPAASAAVSSFGNLAHAVSSSRAMSIGNGERTIEELVKELMRPMLKAWLDANLPLIVQRAVEREVARLAGRGEDKG